MRKSTGILLWLTLQCTAFGWSAALAIAAGALFHVPVAVPILALSYLLPALGRRHSGWIGFLSLVALPVAVALLPITRDGPHVALLLLASGLRAATAPRTATVSSLRAESRTGLAALVLAALAVAVAQASPWSLALTAGIFLIGSFIGLPLAQAATGGQGEGALAKARAGLELYAAFLGVAVLLAGAIAIGHQLLARLPGAWLRAFLWLLWPFAYLSSWVIVSLRDRGVRFRFPRPPQGHRAMPKGHDAAAPLIGHLIGPLAVLAALGVLVLAYLIYRRAARRADEAAADARAAEPRAFALARPGTDHNAGHGPRWIVRRAMARHLRGRPLPPNTTARRLAAREGWPDPLLEAYEHARYAFRRPFAVERARAFLATFRRHAGRPSRGQRRPPG